MNQENLSEQILKLKKEKDAILLVHNYQRDEIQLLADHLGDSLGLSRIAAQAKERMIVFCGVMFMAETAKILSPEKIVLLPRLDAGCPMAEMADVKGLQKLKDENPDAMLISYVNSTAEVKAITDVCCTSANAVQVVQNVKADKIIFAPDRNLASWVQRFTDKQIIPWDGFCYVHDQFTVEEVETARAKHPDGVIVAHPECPKEVVDLADEVFSTSGMVKFAKESNAKKFILGTEAGMLDRLKRENPDKTFFALGSVKVCRGMKTTRLEDLHQALENNQHQIELDPVIMNRARKSLERMLEYV
ncbi:quinolinate synthase NadA [candidate division KSB1 bacterium]|nr:quinolinate synthase NadA [candidate division KSB1 bacterium]